MRNITWVNLMAGVWLLIAGLLIAAPALSHAAVANDVVVGILLVAASLWLLASPASAPGVGRFQVICGIWMILAPFVLRYSGLIRPTTNAVFVGVLVSFIGVFESMSARPRPA